MARSEAVRHAFNRGLISPLALGRVDLKRSALSAEIQTNWMPRTLGSMMLRPGLQYVGATASNAAANYVEFVRSSSAKHLLEFTNAAMRIWTNDALLTRPAVTSAIANGTFPTNFASWTDNDEVGGVSAWISAGNAGFTGNGTAAAIRDQVVTVAGANIGVEHALRVVVNRGPITIRVGTTAGDDSYIAEATLGTGYHSLALTPTGDFNIRFMSRHKRLVILGSCTIEAAGVVSLTSPYLAADLDNIRADTDSLSVDVMFVGCVGYQQRRIERRAAGRSWSVALYAPEDGPFRNDNTSTQTMAPTAISGNTTLTSSVAFFRSTHVGALFKVESIGQTVSSALALLNDATNSIRVTGITTDRNFTIVLAGMTAGRTVILQRSFDNATWVAVAGQTWAADVTTSYTDGLDNQIVYYRLIITVVGAAGATTATLTIATGSVIGICRVTAFTTSLAVSVEVITDFGGTTASTTWAEGLWSDFRGWPGSGTIYEGRMGWGGFDSINLSVSDAFDSFDAETVGDSGPINRSIGSGPMDTINWMLPLQRLILGAQMAEHSVRSNAFDEPITPSNFNRKQCSTQGSAPVQAIRIDSRGIYIQRGGNRVFELSFNTETYDYHSTDLTMLNPEVCKPSVVRMAVQRRPDTRIHCVLSDGTVAIQVYDAAEQVNCWVKFETDGDVEDVCVLPGGAGTDEDIVYYVVNRTINGATVRYLEKWATEAECQGTYSTSTTLNKQADSFVICNAGVGGATLTGLTHLIGETVVAWANGKDLGDYTVNGSGEITLSEAAGSAGAIVGLEYTALFQSAKLGQTLSKHKNIDHLSAILHNTHAQGLWVGPDFTNMDNLALIQEGAPVDETSTYASFDHDPQEFIGTWDIDARVCLKAVAPRPCTVLACVIEGQVSG